MPPKTAALASETVIVPINDHSDGDLSHRPTAASLSRIDPGIYLEKVAAKWMEDRGEAVPVSKENIYETGPVDEEGTPEILSLMVQKLKKEGYVDEPMVEPLSMDWRAERHLLPERIQKDVHQYSFIPRAGELVLFVREIVGNIVFDLALEEHRIVDPATKKYTGYPQWEAGTVGQVAEEKVLIEDIIMETKKEYNVNRSGFRIECMSDLNNHQKGYSKQYKYVPMHHIRPLCFWQEHMNGIDREDWHPTVKHALKATSSFSLVGKYRFRGQWPNATLFCKGIYLGAEVIFVGDAVRLIPTNEEDNVEDVLKINSIRLKFSNLDAEDTQQSKGIDPLKIVIRLVGKAYTLNPDRAFSPKAINSDEITGSFPPGMHGYDAWYYLHDPKTGYQVSLNRVLGRCFEGEAMTFWFDEASMEFGVEGVRQARSFAREKDKRIPAGRKWYWAETRADSLDLKTLNGLEVGKYDRERDPAIWRKMIRIIDGVVGEMETKVAREVSEVSKPAVTFTARDTGMVKTAVQDDETEASSEEEANGDKDEDEQAADELVGALVEGRGFGPTVGEEEEGENEEEEEDDEDDDEEESGDEMASEISKRARLDS
ncbi:MAG: hypothetical protein M1827_001266 [Pycnora praestabilis]|nr:MAG: hypothetical protein M1827_001266 [Pycnora praestabilis]